MTRRHPPEKKARALELAANGEPPANIARTLNVPRATIRDWLRAAGINTAPRTGSKTAAATEAAAEIRAQAREELATDLLQRLARPAVERIAVLLDEDAGHAARCARAAADLDDAVALVRAAADLDPDAAKEARARAKAAADYLDAVTRLRLTARELVGVLTRAVGDHLALEGIAAEDTGDVVVEFRMPRPDPAAWDAQAVDEADLPQETSP